MRATLLDQMKGLLRLANCSHSGQSMGGVQAGQKWESLFSVLTSIQIYIGFDTGDNIEPL